MRWPGPDEKGARRQGEPLAVEEAVADYAPYWPLPRIVTRRCMWAAGGLHRRDTDGSRCPTAPKPRQDDKAAQPLSSSLTSNRAIAACGSAWPTACAYGADGSSATARIAARNYMCPVEASGQGEMRWAVDWELNAEQLRLRQAALELGRMWAPRRTELRDHTYRAGAHHPEFWDCLRAAGFIGALVPSGLGGTGVGVLGAAAVLEGLAEGGAPTPFPVLTHVVARAVDRAGPPVLRQRVLSEVAPAGPVRPGVG